jgi:hypothetical protein
MPEKFLPFSPISEGPIEAQSDIADHGYRTECPPMGICEENKTELFGTLQTLRFIKHSFIKNWQTKGFVPLLSSLAVLWIY